MPVDLKQRIIERERPAQQVKLKRTLIPRAWKKKTSRAANMIESFYHAFHGIWVGLREERNVRIHFLSALLVLGLGLWLKVDQVGWVALALAIGLVLTTEFLNTALEHLVDIASNGEYHDSARYAKDTAAAAVLCASGIALIIGAVIFVPRLMHLL